jgi:hypothetical protein
MRKFFNLIVSRSWLAEILSFLGASVYFYQLCYYADYQYSVLDEGLYLYKGLLFASGKYAPFQEYGPWTNQMPLSFLIPGWVQVIFGPGLQTGRYFAIALAVLMLVALWLTSRRLGGSWLAALSVWVFALNPATSKLFSMFISQGMVACLLMWIMWLVLGAERRRWQIVLGGLVAGILVMARINMIPLLFLLVLYIWWERGWKDALWILLAEAVVVIATHAAYWPGILQIWAKWLPDAITPFLAPWRPPLDSTPTWNPDNPFGYRIASFFLAFRYHFVAMIGPVAACLLWPKRENWKNNHYRISVFLLVLFFTLFAVHAWASLANDYCVFCFPTYSAFYSGIGLLLLAATAKSWRWDAGRLRWIIIIGVMAGLLGGMAYSAERLVDDLLGPAFFRRLLEIPLPRIRNGQLLAGQAQLWQVIANRLGIGYETIKEWTLATTPLILGGGLGILIAIVSSVVSTQVRKRQGIQTRAILALCILLGLGFIFLPTSFLGNSYTDYDCHPGELNAYATAGTHLAGSIPPGSTVYWAGYSPTLLLYLKDINIYPAQLNMAYSYRKGHDSDALQRYGWWNSTLAQQWAREADFILITQRNYNPDNWMGKYLNSGVFNELPPTVPVAICQDNSYIRIFQRKP